MKPESFEIVFRRLMENYGIDMSLDILKKDITKRNIEILNAGEIQYICVHYLPAGHPIQIWYFENRKSSAKSLEDLVEMNKDLRDVSSQKIFSHFKNPKGLNGTNASSDDGYEKIKSFMTEIQMEIYKKIRQGLQTKEEHQIAYNFLQRENTEESEKAKLVLIRNFRKILGKESYYCEFFE